MARRARQRVERGSYHLTTRGTGSDAIFVDDEDRQFFLQFLHRAVVREGWRCLAFCLMTTHYHLVVSVPDDSVPRGMHWLNGIYGRVFNGRHARRGHVFGDRYRLTYVRDERHLGESCRYVVCNPVRAGLCAHAREWPWSSYRATSGEEEPPPFLDVVSVRRLFGSAAGYAAYVAAAT